MPLDDYTVDGHVDEWECVDGEDVGVDLEGGYVDLGFPVRAETVELTTVVCGDIFDVMYDAYFAMNWRARGERSWEKERALREDVVRRRNELKGLDWGSIQVLSPAMWRRWRCAEAVVWKMEKLMLVETSCRRRDECEVCWTGLEGGRIL